MTGDAREHVGQPGLRVDAIHLGCDDEAVQYPSAGGRLLKNGKNVMLRS